MEASKITKPDFTRSEFNGKTGEMVFGLTWKEGQGPKLSPADLSQILSMAVLALCSDCPLASTGARGGCTQFKDITIEHYVNDLRQIAYIDVRLEAELREEVDIPGPDAKCRTPGAATLLFNR